MSGFIAKFRSRFNKQIMTLAALMVLNFVGAMIVTLLLEEQSAATKAIVQVAMIAAISIISCLVLIKLNQSTREVARTIGTLSSQDKLTGLANREAFMQQVQETVDPEEGDPAVAFALLLIDIDRFKELNAFVGYDEADNILRQVADRLEELAVTKFDAARLSGDEFGLMVRYDGTNADLDRKMQGVFDRLYQSYRCEDLSVDLTFSVGITLFPDDGTVAESLNHNAYFALQRAKQEGHDRICCYDEIVDPKMRDEQFLSQDMDRALQAGEFVLYYQPQFSFATGEQSGYEALIRWNHKDRGLIPPSTFIPIAEKNGFILPISSLVLRRACETASQWTRPLKVAVNLSPVQMRQWEIADQVLQVLNDTGLPPKQLELEVTESLFLDINDKVTDDLIRLQKLGISIALDDFGTGYSSLSYLTSFPFDKIKIDRSFVQNLDTDPSAMTIVSTIIGLGKNLNARVTAEGIETRQAFEMLRLAGCDEAQGYLLGKPRDIERIPGDEIKPLEQKYSIPA